MRGMRRKKKTDTGGSFIKLYTFGNINSPRRMHAAITLVKGIVTQEEALGCLESQLMFFERPKVQKIGITKKL